MVKRSKRMKALVEKVADVQSMPLSEAVPLLKTFDNTKF
nr:50S ribosomal protein L1 [bacterium]